MNTYNQEQIQRSLELLTDIWGDQREFISLPDESRERLAEIVLRAFKILPKE